MARLLQTVDELVEQVRSMLDEDNVEAVDTEKDILPALNRGQDYAFNILARHYEEPLLATTSIQLVAGKTDYDIPEDVFEDRIEKIEIEVQGTFREVRRLSYRDISVYQSDLTNDIPFYYTIFGRKIKFATKPSGVYTARVWYLRAPEELVLSQGRIGKIDSAPTPAYVTVDSLGSGISKEVNDHEAYVNVVDGQTGEIKGTCQVKSISSNTVTFKLSPDTPVLNRTLTSFDAVSGVQVNDYLANIRGTCVPYFSRPISNFLIQYAVAELQRKLGGPADMELRVLEKFEQQVERSWVGREQSMRVKKRSKNWEVPFRRWYWTRS